MRNYWEPVERQWQEQFLGQPDSLLGVARDAHEFVADVDRVLHHKEEELLAV